MGSGQDATEQSTGRRPLRFHWLIVAIERWLHRSCHISFKRCELDKLEVLAGKGIVGVDIACAAVGAALLSFCILEENDGILA